jgi:hypothetical protein
LCCLDGANIQRNKELAGFWEGYFFTKFILLSVHFILPKVQLVKKITGKETDNHFSPG